MLESAPDDESRIDASNVIRFPGVVGDDAARAEAEDALVRALARAPKSEREADAFLREHAEIGEIERELILDHLRSLGYLDDARLAEQLRTGRLARKGLGRSGIRQELRARGIAADLVETELAELDPDDELEHATELAQDRARRAHGLDRDTAERRLRGYLARRGYTGDVVTRAVRAALDG